MSSDRVFLNDRGEPIVTHGDIASALIDAGTSLYGAGSHIGSGPTGTLLLELGNAFLAAGYSFQLRHEKFLQQQQDFEIARAHTRAAMQRAAEARQNVDPKRPKQWWRVW